MTTFDEILEGLKGGVFISHLHEEKKVALVLQKYLRLAFGKDFPVFVSSDSRSIGPGKKWFDYIIENLRFRKVLIVLISQESKKREWINFEAGFADGAGALVIPVTIKGLSVGATSFPLAGYQTIAVDEIMPVLDAVSEKVNLPVSDISPIEYARDLHAAEAALIYRSLKLNPILTNEGGSAAICWDIENVGNADLELLMVELYVPRAIVDPNWTPGAAFGIEHSVTSKNDRQYDWLSCYSARGAHSQIIPTLRPVVTPSMGKIPLRSMRVPLRGPIDQLDRLLRVHYQIHALNYSTEPESIALGDIPCGTGAKS